MSRRRGSKIQDWVKAFICELFNYQCAYCGEEISAGWVERPKRIKFNMGNGQMHHTIPRKVIKINHLDEPKYLVLTCSRCHNEKHGKL